jgi:RNA polymerase sigma-70 factor (ECF subfamily)
MTDLSPEEDDRLMLALQGGDGAAFAALVARHEPRLLGFFSRRLHDRQLAEDLTQETFLRLHEHYYDYLPRRAFRAWLFRIAYHILVDKTRKRSNDVLIRASRGRAEDGEDSLAWIEAEQRSPDLEAAETELVRLVHKIAPTLPLEQWMTFSLYHFEGLTLPAIADVMETSVPTTKGRLRLARQKLREELKKHGYEPPWSPSDELDADSPAGGPNDR